MCDGHLLDYIDGGPLQGLKLKLFCFTETSGFHCLLSQSVAVQQVYLGNEKVCCDLVTKSSADRYIASVSVYHSYAHRVSLCSLPDVVINTGQARAESHRKRL